MKQEKTKIENQKIEKEFIKTEKETEAESLPSITPAKLKIKMFKENPPLIVDTRSNILYQKSHILNSIQLNDLNPTQNNKNIVLVTNNENDSTLVSLHKSLTSAGNQVHILTGGLDAWKNSGGTIISFGDPESFIDQSKVKLVEPRDVNKVRTENPENILIIDVRREGNFKKSHIPNAINIPLLELEKKHRDISMKKNIYVYGADELTSFSAGVILYDLGFFNVKTINGGFIAWEKYEYPVEANK
ncbi:MAG: rhodanese-like domain-containing protein [Candidatus Moranbacteria bacterium]|nr:rhodanese-like domain-containing protein [Candidatus Moranbacteria bacterium]